MWAIKVVVKDAGAHGQDRRPPVRSSINIGHWFNGFTGLCIALGRVVKGQGLNRFLVKATCGEHSSAALLGSRSPREPLSVLCQEDTTSMQSACL